MKMTSYWLVLKVAIFCCGLVIALWIFKPLFLIYFYHYARISLKLAYNDDKRHEEITHIHAATEWRLHEYEMQFNNFICKSKPATHKKYVWLTAMTNDDFVIGAVATAYAIQKLSCNKKMFALVSNGVSNSGLSALEKAGYDVRLAEALDCNWMDRKKRRKERNLGITGTHMRFAAWNYTEYDKILYFDADIVPLSNIDNLFEIEGDLAAAYCSKPGIFDPCFNAGLIVFHPSQKDFFSIMKMWSDLSETNCPNDQVLLWHYYADSDRWTPLPYAYNVRRAIYHPMKLYHFACCLTPKPWRIKTPPSKSAVTKFSGPILEPRDMVTLWWRYFYQALHDFDLHEWWEKAQGTIKNH